MQMFRTNGQEATATTGFNPSTQRLMSRYLQQSDTFVQRVGNVNHQSKKKVYRFSHTSAQLAMIHFIIVSAL